MYKIKRSSENISPFSGLNFIFSAIIGQYASQIWAKTGFDYFNDFKFSKNGFDIKPNKTSMPILEFQKL